MTHQLPDLRARLDALDAQLVRTAAERLGVVRQIGEAKRGTATPVFNRAREREVRANARAVAAEHDLPLDIADALIGVIFEASHRLQAEGIAARARSGEARDILVVGGAGKMGQRFARVWTARGHRVDIYDVDDPRPLAEVVGAAQIIVISVPMLVATEVARQVAPHVRPDALLCDFNSLKSEICAAYATCPGEAVGLHPMFGPSVHTLLRQKVVVCPVKSGPLTAWLRQELEQLGCELVESTPTAHDQMMAIVQVLVHFRTLVTGSALRRCGADIHESLRFTSPIYRLELAFCGRLFAQDPDLYATIEMANPHGTEIRTRFLESAAELLRMIETNDRDGFRATFEDTTRWFDGFSAEAMELSDHIIDAMVAWA